MQNVSSYLFGEKQEAEIPEISPAAAAPLKRPRDSLAAGVHSTGEAAFSLADHERRLRCRDNLQIVPGKDFSKALEIYKVAEQAYMALQKAEKQQHAQVLVSLLIQAAELLVWDGEYCSLAQR
jgi:hypothetical protein